MAKSGMSEVLQIKTRKKEAPVKAKPLKCLVWENSVTCPGKTRIGIELKHPSGSSLVN